MVPPILGDAWRLSAGSFREALPWSGRMEAVREFVVRGAGRSPYGIAAGPDGALWFTEWGANRVGRITAGGEVSGVALPTPGAEPHGIAAGPDGALWVALEAGRIARVAPG
jgi:virginiamycin B lyase